MLVEQWRTASNPPQSRGTPAQEIERPAPPTRVVSFLETHVRPAGESVVPYNHGVRTAGGGFLYTAVERLVNLALYLSAAREPVSAEDIRAEVQGYAPDQADEAFKRQFERDKDDLRTAGLVILTDAENEGYYRLDRSGTFAAPLDLTRRGSGCRAAAASALLDDPSFPFSDDLRLAMAKIASATDSGDVPAAARLADEDPEHQGAIVAQLADAAGRRKSVDFGYTNSQGASAPHAVEPYGLFLHDGRWYLVGRDTRQGRAPHLHRGPHVRHRGEPGPPQVARLRAAATGSTWRASCASPSSTDLTHPEFEALIRFEPSAAWRDGVPLGGSGLHREGWRRGLCGALRRVLESRLLQFVIDNGPGLRLVEPRDAVGALRSGLEEVIRRPWLRPAPPIARDA